MMTLYLTGPRPGLDARPDAYQAAARKLRTAGFTVLSLADFPDAAPDLPWTDYLRAGIRMLLETDGVARIHGQGRAPLEILIAHELHLPVKSVPGWLTQARATAHMDRIRS